MAVSSVCGIGLLETTAASASATCFWDLARLLRMPRASFKLSVSDWYPPASLVSASVMGAPCRENKMHLTISHLKKPTWAELAMHGPEYEHRPVHLFEPWRPTSALRRTSATRTPISQPAFLAPSTAFRASLVMWDCVMVVSTCMRDPGAANHFKGHLGAHDQLAARVAQHRPLPRRHPRVTEARLSWRDRGKGPVWAAGSAFCADLSKSSGS